MRAAPLVRVLLVLLAALAAGGCITDPVTGSSTIGMPTSDAEESRMGLAYRPAIVAEYGGPYPDPELQQYLSALVLGMARSSVRPDLPWTFTVLNTSIPNAFAVPGGQVFVTRGMLNRMTDEGEFAVVMGHELGHVEHRHSVQAMGRQALFGGLASAVAIGVGEEFGDVAGTGLQLLELGYSRDQERESDARGVDASLKAGYDPREGADVFRMFLAMKQEMGDDTPWFLSTHPADEERIENILALCAARDPRLAGDADVPGLRRTTATWSRLKERLAKEQKTYDVFDAAMKSLQQAKGTKEAVAAAVPQFERCARELPGHALLHATLGKAKVIAGDVAGGRASLERASSLDQSILDPEWILGVLAIEDKQWDKARTHAERGLRILPENYLCLAVRGEAHWNSGRKAEAQADFEAVVRSAPQDSDEYRHAASRLGGDTGPGAPRKKRRK